MVDAEYSAGKQSDAQPRNVWPFHATLRGAIFLRSYEHESVETAAFDFSPRK
jgi:hypothetical protein